MDQDNIQHNTQYEIKYVRQERHSNYYTRPMSMSNPAVMKWISHSLFASSDLLPGSRPQNLITCYYHTPTIGCNCGLTIEVKTVTDLKVVMCRMTDPCLELANSTQKGMLFDRSIMPWQWNSFFVASTFTRISEPSKDYEFVMGRNGQSMFLRW